MGGPVEGTFAVLPNIFVGVYIAALAAAHGGPSWIRLCISGSVSMLLHLCISGSVSLYLYPIWILSGSYLDPIWILDTQIQIWSP